MSKHFWKVSCSGLGLVLLAATLAVPTYHSAQAAGSLQRIAGPNRLGTAIEASRQLFAATDSAGGVVLARQDGFADALAASSLAGLVRGPILLTPANAALDPLVLDEINRVLAPGKPVFIIGGTSALSSSLEGALGQYAVTRLAGQDRFETATLIKKRGDTVRGSVASAAFFVRGDTYPDALSVSSYAALSGTPILLVQQNLIPQTVADLLDSTLATAYVVGGTSAVSDGVLTTIESATNNLATRLAGANRYETSALIAEYFFPSPLAVLLATGENFPDALAGGVLAGLSLISPSGLPVLLITQNSVPSPVGTYLTDNAATIDDVTSGYVMGGEAAVSLDTELYLEGRL
ncbi:MAG: cell wall-binding repeat-containing protein [Candidatus Andersenbacteria bacterium]